MTEKKKYKFVVLSNALEGRDDDYNEWFDNRHLDDVLAIPGVVAAQRYKVAHAQRIAPPFPYGYMANYYLETEDLQGVLDEIGRRNGTEVMPKTDAAAPGVFSLVFEEITGLVTASE